MRAYHFDPIFPVDNFRGVIEKDCFCGVTYYALQANGLSLVGRGRGINQCSSFVHRSRSSKQSPVPLILEREKSLRHDGVYTRSASGAMDRQRKRDRLPINNQKQSSSSRSSNATQRHFPPRSKHMYTPPPPKRTRLRSAAFGIRKPSPPSPSSETFLLL